MTPFRNVGVIDKYDDTKIVNNDKIRKRKQEGSLFQEDLQKIK